MSDKDEKKAEETKEEKPAPKDNLVVTQHKVRIGGKEIYPAHSDTARKTTGQSEFTLKLAPNNFGVLLRRKLDYAYPNERAEVFAGTAAEHPVEVVELDGAGRVGAAQQPAVRQLGRGLRARLELDVAQGVAAGAAPAQACRGPPVQRPGLAVDVELQHGLPAGLVDRGDRPDLAPGDPHLVSGHDLHGVVEPRAQRAAVTPAARGEQYGSCDDESQGGDRDDAGRHVSLRRGIGG